MRKKEKTPIPIPSVESLTTEQQRTFSWFTNLIWPSTETKSDETKASTIPVITLAVEDRSETSSMIIAQAIKELSNTSSSLHIEQPIHEQSEATPYSWYNTLSWRFGFGTSTSSTHDGEEEIITVLPVTTHPTDSQEPTTTDTETHTVAH